MPTPLEHLKIPSGRPVGRDDVFTAADALLLAGDRATVARVREVLGKGSPNTIAPHLQEWFKALGKRIQDPKAFAEPSGHPKSVVQAFDAVLHAARVEATKEADRTVAEIRDLAAARIERAEQAAAEAERLREVAAMDAARAQGQADTTQAQLDAERVAHGTTTGRLNELVDQLKAATQREAAVRNELDDVRESSQALVAAAQERADGAQRRAGLEIDKEREGRKDADRRAEAAERRVERAQAVAAAQRETDFASINRTASELATTIEKLGRTQSDLEREVTTRAQLQRELDDAREAMARSSQEAATLRERLREAKDALAKSPSKRRRTPAKDD